MPEHVTFLQAADVHLGAPFKGLRHLTPAWADRLRESIPRAFERTIQAALDHRVDFVVFAGDTFDLSQPSYGEYLQFLDGMTRLEQAGISVYMVTGNHDPMTTWRSDYGTLPANVHMLPAAEPGFLLHLRDGQPLAIIGGRGYYNRMWTEAGSITEGVTRADAEWSLRVKGQTPDALRGAASASERDRALPAGVDPASAPFAIGIAHTGLNIDPTKAPVDPAELYASGMDYWCLGHIHSPHHDSDTEPRLVFSGCLQGRATKETGPHGVNLVTLTKGAPARVTFVPTAEVVWEKLKFDVSPCKSLAELNDALLEQLLALNAGAYCDRMIERITLTGQTPLHATLAQPGVLEEVRRRLNESYDFFYCESIVDRTRAVRDKKALRAEGLFPAVLLERDRDRDEAAVRADNAAYLQVEFAKRSLVLPQLKDATLKRLASEANDVALDYLGGDR